MRKIRTKTEAILGGFSAKLSQCDFELQNLYAVHTLMTNIFGIIFERTYPEGACGVKKKFQKTLTLAFEVIMKLLIHTLLIALIFPFFAHCEILMGNLGCNSLEPF